MTLTMTWIVFTTLIVIVYIFHAKDDLNGKR